MLFTNIKQLQRRGSFFKNAFAVVMILGYTLQSMYVAHCRVEQSQADNGRQPQRIYTWKYRWRQIFQTIQTQGALPIGAFMLTWERKVDFEKFTNPCLFQNSNYGNELFLNLSCAGLWEFKKATILSPLGMALLKINANEQSAALRSLHFHCCTSSVDSQGTCHVSSCVTRDGEKKQKTVIHDVHGVISPWQI